MPQYLVLTLEGDEVPGLGGTAHATVYRGDHADEDDAVVAAANDIEAPSGKKMWAVSAGQLHAYTNTTTITRTVAAG